MRMNDPGKIKQCHRHFYWLFKHSKTRLSPKAMSRLLSVLSFNLKRFNHWWQIFYFETFHDSRRRFQEGCGIGSERQEDRELNFYHLKIPIHILSACPKDERTRWMRRVLECRNRENQILSLSPRPTPRGNYWGIFGPSWVVWPVSPSTPDPHIRERYLPYSSPAQCT